MHSRSAPCLRTSYPHPQVEENHSRAPVLIRSAEDRYRILLDASSAVADQPTVKDVLRSLRSVLSNISCVYSAGLYLLTADRKGLKLFAYDRNTDGVAVPIGTEVPCSHAFARAVERQERVYIPDVAQEMRKVPQLAPFASRVGIRRSYLFPVATSRKQYGVVAFTSEQGRDFGNEDVELMGSLASHIAVAVETAIYQQQLAEERNRFSLLLEINNHIVGKLEVCELFQAVATSMRKHFAHDAIAFWLVNKQSGCLERSFLEFPTGRGFLEKVDVVMPSNLESEWWRIRTPQFYAPRERPDLPAAIREAAKAESLVSGVSVPLVGANGPLGLMNMSSRRADVFSESDRDLLSQIGTQISLVLDNALTHGQLRAAHDDLQRSQAYLAEAERLNHTASWAWSAANRQPVYWSEEMYRIFGLDPQEGVPSAETFRQSIHPDDLEHTYEVLMKAAVVNMGYEHEYRIVLPDGTLKHIHAIGHPVLDENGHLAEYVGTAIDITERKRAEEALRTSKTQLAHERDRLCLLLEINNHIISKLEVDELFRAVACSMRKHLGSDATTFWLINKQSGCLERKYLDFPDGKGFLEKVEVVMPGNLESEWWRMRAPQFYSPQDMPQLAPAIRDAVKAESLVSRASVPLVGANGPLGLLNISSRKADEFGEGDRDLLSQIGNQISLALDNALTYGSMRASRDRLEDQRVYLESEISSEYNFEDIVGKSSAIKRVLRQLTVVAPIDSTVLLHGETGTGKELIARAIHNRSSRRERTFVRMNCAAIPSGLLESELFGHERGAFTGALMQRRGRFELADHGTLFLDEIGDISLELQPKLLRAVQEQEFERLGSAKTIHVNVRIIAATHRDLSAMIREGKFREDLFYRLNVFPIEIPPLRERREDIPLLVHHFVSKLSRRIGKQIKSISEAAMDVLTNSPWRGNVRELANFLERAVILTQGDELQVPMGEFSASSARQVPAAMTVGLQAAERAIIMDALKASSGRISGKGGAAERLGLKRTTLQHKINRLGIKLILDGAGPAPSKLGIPGSSG